MAIEVMETQGTMQQEAAPNPESYLRKSESRVYSDFALIAIAVTLAAAIASKELFRGFLQGQGIARTLQRIAR